jgi:hypothetical protein
MATKYQLQIATKSILDVSHVLGLESEDNTAYWSTSITCSDDKEYINFIDHFRKLLEGKLKKLSYFLEGPDPITIWILYEYENQCNMEFSLKDLQDFEKMGAGLCISCWEKYEKA